jgi:integrase
MCDPRVLKLAQPGELIRDDQVKGLHVRVTATAKSWYLYYRSKDGAERRPKLGEFPTLGVAEARKAAKAILDQVAVGKDPSAEWQAARNAPTMTMLWDAWRSDRGLKKKTSDEDDRMWNRYCLRLHNRKVADITYDDINALHKGIPAKYQANAVIRLLSTLLNFAVAPKKWIMSNPCDGLEKNPERKRQRYMSMDEAKAIARELTAAAATEPKSVLFIYLLIYTGARKSEIGKFHWNQIVGDAIVLTEHKTDGYMAERVIHLPPQAVALLESLPRGEGPVLGIADPKKFWGALRKRAGCPDLRMHDLRHSFASVAISAGLNLSQIGLLLGHQSTQTTQRYAHLMDSAGTALATTTAAHLEGMLREGA